MKLEPGKFYETADGEVFGPMRPNWCGRICGNHWESLCGSNGLWRNDGTRCGGQNLIREHNQATLRTYYVVDEHLYHDKDTASLVAGLTGDEVVTVREVV